MAACFAAAAALAVAAAVQAAQIPDRYTARWDPVAEAVSVEACFDGAPPDRLRRHQSADRFTDGPSHGARALAVPADSRALGLPALPDGACIDWRVRLGEAADAGDRRAAFRSGGTILSAADLWFWRPAEERPVTIAVRLPPDERFSAPWPLAPAADGRTFGPVFTPHWWRSRTAFGPLETRTLEFPGGKVELVISGSLDAAQHDRLARWVRESAAAVVPVLGALPVPRLQTVVVPVGSQREPVPWAHVLRGGGPAVEFFVDASRPLAEFRADWTATHEFSHLLLPYVAWNDRWLSEGLASYYQNVLRARDGRLDEREAWQRLHDGFARGRRATRPVPLTEAARGGRGATMRVYWAGAAMMLAADVRLRDVSGGRLDLDQALRMLHACCVEPGASWRAQDLLRKLDELAGTGVFMALYREQATARSFPDLAALYESLGLTETDGRIELSDTAPRAGIRRAIMSPPAPPAGPGGGTEAPAPGNAPPRLPASPRPD